MTRLRISTFMFSFVAGFIALCSGSTPANAAIFGVDNRHIVNEASPALELARATAVAVISTNIETKANGTFDLLTDPLISLCKDDSLYAQPSLNYACTGFLIAPDLLVTAGHCVYAVNTPHQELKNETKLACEAFSWLFDYQRDDKRASASAVQTTGLASDRLFHCKQIIYARQTEKAPLLDYALIQLDRPAFGRTPYKLATAPVTSGTAVAMVGYPFGTAATYTDSAVVTLNNTDRDSFLTSLDAFEGNSGSPVFNAAHAVVGILISGTPSANTYTDSKNSCERLNRCDEHGGNCRAPDASDIASKISGYQGVGSEVQRIQPIIDLLKSQK